MSIWMLLPLHTASLFTVSLQEDIATKEEQLSQLSTFTITIEVASAEPRSFSSKTRLAEHVSMIRIPFV